MTQWRVAVLIVSLLSSVAVSLGSAAQAVAQSADFQIVWVVVGEVEANAAEHPVRVGRHLFMAPELMSLTMNNVKVVRIDVAPAVTHLAAGQQLCISSLNMKAYDPSGTPLKSGPLSISVRQDQKQKLALERKKGDICVAPTAAGEYPIRFASLLPAPDGTVRGAQIFVRVGEISTSDQAAATRH